MWKEAVVPYGTGPRFSVCRWTREWRYMHSGRKVTGLGNVTVIWGKRWKEQGGARLPTVCLSMYSITENIYYSQLSSVGILLQPEPVSHRIIQGKDCFLSPYMLSSCGLPLPPTCLLLTVNEAIPSYILILGRLDGGEWSASLPVRFSLRKELRYPRKSHCLGAGFEPSTLAWSVAVHTKTVRPRVLPRGPYIKQVTRMCDLRYVAEPTVNLPPYTE
jgi:hypothetical protein